MIDAAGKKFPAMRFEVCDARDLRFSQEFDAVFSNAALHWIPEAQRVVDGIARALKRAEGSCGVRRQRKCPPRGHCSGKRINATRHSGKGRQSLVLPEHRGISALLESHRLEVIEAALFERPTSLEDGERGLQTWLTMFGAAFLDRVPPARQQAFLRAVEVNARPALWKSDHCNSTTAGYESPPASFLMVVVKNMPQPVAHPFTPASRHATFCSRTAI